MPGCESEWRAAKTCLRKLEGTKGRGLPVDMSQRRFFWMPGSVTHCNWREESEEDVISSDDWAVAISSKFMFGSAETDATSIRERASAVTLSAPEMCRRSVVN